MWSFLGLAVAAAFSAAALKRYSPEIAAAIAVGAGAWMLLSVLSRITPVLGEIRRLMESAGMNSVYGSVLLKTVGICFLCQFTADACRDAGQSSLAAKVELACKTAVLLISLPLFETILGLVTALIAS